MEKYIIGNNKWLWLLMITMYLSCQLKDDKSIPQDIIVKSTEFTIRKYKKYLYPKVYILKNEFTESAKMVNIDGLALHLIDEKDIKSSEISTIEFYKFKPANGDVEIELVLMPRRQYIKFHFKKSGNKIWDFTNVTPWQD